MFVGFILAKIKKFKKVHPDLVIDKVLYFV